MYKALTMEEYVVEEEKLNHEVVVFGCGSAAVVLIVEPINVSVSSKSSFDASSNESIFRYRYILVKFDL